MGEKTSINQALIDLLSCTTSEWTLLALEAIMLCFTISLKIVATSLESLFCIYGKLSNSPNL